MKASKARQARYRARKREAGLVEVILWVPAADKAKLQAFARELAKKSPHGAGQ